MLPRLIFFILALVLLYFLIFEDFNSVNDTISKDTSSYTNTNSEDESPGEVNDNSEPLSLSITSNEDLSPDSQSAFVLSFYFKEEVPPRYDRRQRLVTHYEAETKPYQGWAVAYRRFPTSYRFEFYLKDDQGNGGWFTFDSIDLKKNSLYAVTFILKPGDFIKAYIQQLNNEYEPVNNNINLGGFSLKDVVEVDADSTLQVTSGKPAIGPFEGDVSELLILKLKDIPKENTFAKISIKGSRSLLETYTSSCIISLGKSDESSECLINE